MQESKTIVKGYRYPLSLQREKEKRHSSHSTPLDPSKKMPASASN